MLVKPATVPNTEVIAASQPGAAAALDDGSSPIRRWPRRLGEISLLAILVLVTHGASFTQPYWNPDEGFLATQARMLLRGGVLYADVVDRKPPVLPLIYEACFGLLGSNSLWPVRVLALGAHLVTALLLAAMARDRWGPNCGITAGALYVMTSIMLAPSDTQAAAFEVFMLPTFTAAVYFATKGDLLAAGLTAGLTIMTKQTAGVVLLPVGLLLWRSCERVNWRGQLARGAVGLAFPTAVCAAIFGPRRSFFWMINASGSYLTGGISPHVVCLHAIGHLALLATGTLGVVVAILWRRVVHTRDVDLWLWLLGSVVGVAAGFHFFGHYYLELLPPLALLGAGALHQLRIRSQNTLWKVALAYTGCLSLIFAIFGQISTPPRKSHVLRIVAAVRAETNPGQAVFIWGMHPEIYWLADRTPASRFLTVNFLTGYSGGVSANHVGMAYAVPGTWQAFEHEMTEHPPIIIVDDSSGRSYQPSQFPILQHLLKSYYRKTITVDHSIFYRLDD